MEKKNEYTQRDLWKILIMCNWNLRKTGENRVEKYNNLVKSINLHFEKSIELQAEMEKKKNP